MKNLETSQYIRRMRWQAICFRILWLLFIGIGGAFVVTPGFRIWAVIAFPLAIIFGLKMQKAAGKVVELEQNARVEKIENRN